MQITESIFCIYQINVAILYIISAFPICSEPEIIFFILQETGDLLFGSSFFRIIIYKLSIGYIGYSSALKTYPHFLSMVLEDSCYSIIVILVVKIDPVESIPIEFIQTIGGTGVQVALFIFKDGIYLYRLIFFFEVEIFIAG